MSPPLSPWFALAAIFWLQSITNTTSNFSVYSTKLKSHLQINQIQLNNLSVASDIGKLFAWCSAVAADHLPLWSTLLIGSSIGFFAYGLQYLFMSEKIFKNSSYWKYFLLQILAGNSISWIGTASSKALKGCFPFDHALNIVWLSKSYSGLSADMYICIVKEILGSNAGNESIYLLLNSLVPFGLSLLTAPFLVEMEKARTEDGTGTFWVLVFGGATAVYAVVESVIPDSGNSKLRPMVLLVMVGLVAVVPLLKAGEIVRKRMRSRVSPVDFAESDESVSEEEADVEAGSEDREVEGNAEVVSWYTIWSPEFWMYCLVYLCGATMGSVYACNLGQISTAWGTHPHVALAVSSSFGFLGKLSSAPFSPLSRGKYVVARPAIITILMFLKASSFFLLLHPTKSCLFIGTAIIGMCTNAITSIVASMESNLFGDDLTLPQKIVIANITIVGSLLFGDIAAIIYDQEVERRQNVCIGLHCYRRTFIIWGCICFFGTLLGLFLCIRTRKFLLERSFT